ncbi:MAG TPA: radical SAM protein [Candidatus Omnitrophota bacterium]|nr:radical SAM protein [Candidatus Omnitrophota bacterium]
MKILFAYPPTNLSYGWESLFTFPSGIISVASYLKRSNIQIEILHEKEFTSILFINHLKRYRPDCLAFTCNSHNFQSCCYLSKIAKNILPSIIIIFGGYHATYFHNEILKEIDSADIIVRGEGEATFREVATVLQQALSFKHWKRICGISYRLPSGAIHTTPPRPSISNLDKIPLFQYDLIDMNKIQIYGFPYKDTRLLFTTRGCPHNCYFCNNALMWKQCVRYKSIPCIIKEMETCKNNFGTKHFCFLDPTFTLNKTRVYSLCKELLKNKRAFKWSCGTRFDCIDKKLLLAMQKAGCVKIVYGLESFSPRLLKRMGKNQNLSQAVDIINYTHRIGMISKVTFLLGYPGEDETSLLENLKTMQQIHKNVVININLFELYPGTTVYEYLKKNRFISDSIWFKGFHPDEFIRRFYPDVFIKKIDLTKNILEKHFTIDPE